MMPGLFQIISILAVWTLLGSAPVYAGEQVSQNSVPSVEEQVGFTEGVASFLPLREIIRQFSQKTGIPIRLSQRL